MSECIFHRSVRVGIFHCSAIDARTIHQSYGDAGYALRSVHTWKCVCAIRMNATFVYVHLSRAVNERWDTYCIRNVRLDNWFHRFAEVAAHSKILIQDIRHPQFSAINTRFSLSLSLSLSLPFSLSLSIRFNSVRYKFRWFFWRPMFPNLLLLFVSRLWPLLPIYQSRLDYSAMALAVTLLICFPIKVSRR